MATPAAKRQRKEMNGNGSGFGFDVGVNYREGEVSVWTLSCCHAMMEEGSSEQNSQENMKGLRECLHNCHGMSICILCWMSRHNRTTCIWLVRGAQQLTDGGSQSPVWAAATHSDCHPSISHVSQVLLPTWSLSWRRMMTTWVFLFTVYCEAMSEIEAIK